MTTVAASEPATTAARDGELLRVEDLKVYFPIREGVLFERQVGDVRAVDGVSFSIRRGETMGLVGESGCGRARPGAPSCASMTPPRDGSGWTAPS